MQMAKNWLFACVKPNALRIIFVPFSLHLFSFSAIDALFVKDNVHVYYGLVSSTESKVWSIFFFVVVAFFEGLRSSIMRVLVIEFLFCQQKYLEKLGVCVHTASLRDQMLVNFGCIWCKF